MRAHLDNIKIAETNSLNNATGLTRNRERKQTDYQAIAEYEKFSPEKQKQRDRILKFILDNTDKIPSYVGLPGKYWLLERELSNIYKNARIMGIEKDYEIFAKSCQLMPGKDLHRKQIYPWARDVRLDDVPGRTSRMSAIEIARTWTAYYICADLKSVTDEKIIKKGRGRGFYKKWLLDKNAIWYDFTQPITVDTYTTIYNIKNILNQNQKSAICITLQYGRDQFLDGEGEAGRVGVIVKALPGFICKDVWTYKGFKGTQMINICGIALPKREGL